MDVHDISNSCVPGTNVVAIKATNTDAGAAGLVARVIIKEGRHVRKLLDGRHLADQRQAAAPIGCSRVRDSDWLPAKVYGPLGGVLPWGDEIVIADEGSRFMTDPEFVVERLVTDEQAGSLIAMAFNASGDILASREGGGLLLIRDKDNDGTVRNGRAVLRRSEKHSRYSVARQPRVCGGRRAGGRRAVSNHRRRRRRQGDKLTALVKFRGAIGEHGPHTVRLGPDGLLYVLSGNFAQVGTSIDPHSPYVTTVRRRPRSAAV